MKVSRETGFSTLEVIAAVAIIAIALLPIAALQTQLARSQADLAAAQTESTHIQNAAAVLREINPMLTPTGELDLGDRTVLRWSSAAVSPIRPSVNPPGFEVQLYRVRGDIIALNQPLTAVQIDLVGWRSASQDNFAPPTE